jgi:hypothetical protein
MEKTPQNTKSDRQKIAVNESAPLVPIGKSSKLMAIRNKSKTSSAANNVDLPVKENFSDLTPAAKVLQQARTLIDGRINDIMTRFPDAKKNSLFRVRFGSVEAIKALPIATAFKRLDIDSRLPKIGLIEGLDYYGNDTRADKDNR